MSFISPPDFLSKQLQSPRVAKANQEKGKKVDKLLTSKKIDKTHFNLFLRAFKKEEKLEVWAKNLDASNYTLIKTYDFCTSSGKLGPKRRSGDLQIPEGFYKVTTFNPLSTYHLSFKINYPNNSDLHFADKKNPGNDIYIHGECVTIGCIPLGNPNIEELYLLAIRAHNTGGSINVHIFPASLEEKSYQNLKESFKNEPDLLKFWANLKPVYNYFENKKTLPEIGVDSKGSYTVK